MKHPKGRLVSCRFESLSVKPNPVRVFGSRALDEQELLNRSQFHSSNVAGIILCPQCDSNDTDIVGNAPNSAQAKWHCFLCGMSWVEEVVMCPWCTNSFYVELMDDSSIECPKCHHLWESLSDLIDMDNDLFGG